MYFPDPYWKTNDSCNFVDYDGLRIGLDTQWIAVEDDIVHTICRWGRNPPCFMSTDDNGIIHIYTRQYYLQVEKTPKLRIVQRIDYPGKMPKHCTLEQWSRFIISD